MATAEEQPHKKIETELPPEPPLASVPDDVVHEKPVIPLQPHPHEDKDQESKSLALADKTPDPSVKETSKGSLDRDIALAEIEKEKRLSFIKAWEESEQTRVENKAQKQLSDVASWENTKKAAIEAELKKFEEKLEKKKASYAEKMKNKVAIIHKQAEEKKAMVEAKRGEEILKAEEIAAKYRATGQTPKKGLGCFGG